MADLKQLETALINADRAGDAEAARTLAAEIQRQRGASPVSTIQSDAAKPAPNTGIMSVNSANKAIAAVPDAILNTPNRVLNLIKAGVGSGYIAATGKPVPEMLEPTPDPNFTRRLFDKAGFTQDRLEPQTAGQRVLDTTIQGGVAGAMSPANGLRQAATNILMGGGSGATAGATKEATGSDAAAMAAGMLAVPGSVAAINSGKNKLTATALRQQQNAVRDKTIADARDAGYVLSPSETNPSTLNHALEGIAGKLSTRQLASQRNQDVTNQLARDTVGVPEGTALSPALMQQLRRDAYQQGYAPVESAGVMRPGRLYRQALDDIESKYTGAANSFPEAVSDEVRKMVDALRVQQFDAGDAVKMTQILRDNAGKSFASGDNGLGKAQRAAATAIEDQIERGLTGQGQSGSEMLDNFRAARTQMAKTHTVEDALHEGTGNVQANKLAAQLRKGKPLSDGLKTAAMTADAFPKNMQSPEMMGAIPGISPLDVFGGATLGTLGAAATGSPAGALAALAPAARPVVREALLSQPYQNKMGTPTYRNSLLAKFLAQGDVQNQQANQAMIAQILAGQVNQN